MSEWAELNRIIPKGQSARPGPWITESYQREILACITDPYVHEIVCRKSTQVGWSEMLNNTTGYFIDADPKPIMMVQPTDTNAKHYSKKRIAPMIESVPSLRRKVRTATSRRAGNTMALKEFDGGFLKIVGANSGAGLRSDPVAVLLLDEIDGYPLDVDAEGSPVEIAEHRTETFGDYKIFKGSTPAKPRGLSPIDEAFENSSQGYYHVPCPHCGFMQPLFWRHPDDPKIFFLLYEKDKGGNPIPESVMYMCRECKRGIAEKQKQRMLDAGKWVHKFPERRTVRGFHLNALYSPWRPIWAALAKKWVRAQDNPEKLKTFINLSLGESFDEGGDGVEAKALAERKEKFSAEAPMGVAVIVATVDKQQNRLEVQYTGFGAGEEQWLIKHEMLWGDPGQPEVWQDLDDFLLQPVEHESGAQLLPAVTLIDSGDQADAVYNFVMPRQNARRRVLAIKGVEYLSKPGLAARGTTKRGNIMLFTVATVAGKDRTLARLKIPRPGPGYLHLPDWVTDEYLDQLTAEKKVPMRNRTTRAMRYVYVQQHARNEALDLTVYAHAGLFILQNFMDAKTYRDLEGLAKRIALGAARPKPQGRRVRSKGLESG